MSDKNYTCANIIPFRWSDKSIIVTLVKDNGVIAKSKHMLILDSYYWFNIITQYLTVSIKCKTICCGDEMRDSMEWHV